MNYFKGICVIAFAILLVACQAQDKNTLRVGTISGPETKLMETAKKVAKEKYHLNLDIVEFSDYIQPNIALNDGSIDANMFQHQPFLNQQIKDRHFKLIIVGKTFVYPMGIYSKKIEELQQLPLHALVAIPNDPSNEGRALLLLSKTGLIKLSESAGLYATPQNIIENPKALNFKELDAAQIARSLPDVDIAIINTNFAVAAGLIPNKDAIFHEEKDSPYVNVIVVRENEKEDPRIQLLVNAIQSDEVLKTAEEIFKGEAIPTWQNNPIK